MSVSCSRNTCLFIFNFPGDLRTLCFESRNHYFAAKCISATWQHCIKMMRLFGRVAAIFYTSISHFFKKCVECENWLRPVAAVGEIKLQRRKRCFISIHNCFNFWDWNLQQHWDQSAGFVGRLSSSIPSQVHSILDNRTSKSSVETVSVSVSGHFFVCVSSNSFSLARGMNYGEVINSNAFDWLMTNYYSRLLFSRTRCCIISYRPIERESVRIIYFNTCVPSISHKRKFLSPLKCDE